MTVERVPVALPGREYDVLIGPGLIDRAGEHIAPLLRRPRVAVVADENVAADDIVALTAVYRRILSDWFT